LNEPDFVSQPAPNVLGSLVSSSFQIPSSDRSAWIWGAAVEQWEGPLFVILRVLLTATREFTTYFIVDRG
jgi:hypothetical protein